MAKLESSLAPIDFFCKRSAKDSPLCSLATCPDLRGLQRLRVPAGMEGASSEDLEAQTSRTMGPWRNRECRAEKERGAEGRTGREASGHCTVSELSIEVWKT